jgi:uncharacterized membrane protein
MRCKSCGANVAQDAGTCEFCGTTVDRAGSSRGGGHWPERFARIKQSAAYANRNSPERHAALPQASALAGAFAVVFFTIFIGGAAFIAVMMLVMAGVFGFAGFHVGGALGGGVAIIPMLMSVVPIGFVVLGFFLMKKIRQQQVEFKEARVEAEAAIIVGKRTQVSGGGENSSASTSYFVTAEFEDGRREEYQSMTPTLYGKVSDDDAGILFVRSTYALDFDRVT